MFIGSWKVNWKVNSPPKLLGESPGPLKITLGRWSTAKSPRSSLPSTNTGRTSSDASDGQFVVGHSELPVSQYTDERTVRAWKTAGL